MSIARVAVKIPKNHRCTLCGGLPITVYTKSRMGEVFLDELCVAHVMGTAYDGGPEREVSYDQDWQTCEKRRVLAVRIASATPPKSPDLAEAIRNSHAANTHARARASTRITDGGTKLGYIIAWRAWRWEQGRLTGIGIEVEWAEKKADEATCHNHDELDHRPTTLVPVWGCTCGYYACHPKTFLAYLREAQLCLRVGERIIIGTVALWGRVVTHQEGYRAQYAYPIQCFAELRQGNVRPLAWQTARALKHRYGVLIGTPDEVVSRIGNSETGGGSAIRLEREG